MKLATFPSRPLFRWFFGMVYARLDRKGRSEVFDAAFGVNDRCKELVNVSTNRTRLIQRYDVRGLGVETVGTVD